MNILFSQQLWLWVTNMLTKRKKKETAPNKRIYIKSDKGNTEWRIDDLFH